MGLEEFFGLDSGEGGMTPDKVREFQERMKWNAQQMAAAQKQEAKQKKKEDKLAQILLRFIKANKKQDVTLLVARCLEQNIPAVFVLAIILLGNEDIQEEIGIKFQLTPGEKSQKGDLSVEKETGDKSPKTFAELEDKDVKGALIRFGTDQSFPIKMRIAIDLWGKNLFEAASPMPKRILKNACEYNEDVEAEPEPKTVITQLTTFILRDYFADHHFEQNYEKLHAFADFFMKGLMKRVKEQIAEQKELSGEVEEGPY